MKNTNERRAAARLLRTAHRTTGCRTWQRVQAIEEAYRNARAITRWFPTDAYVAQLPRAA